MSPSLWSRLLVVGDSSAAAAAAEIELVAAVLVLCSGVVWVGGHCLSELSS